ncbi:hypothetical protein Hanom_Chr02g00153011 [Helianthus anomalus]
MYIAAIFSSFFIKLTLNSHIIHHVVPNKSLFNNQHHLNHHKTPFILNIQTMGYKMTASRSLLVSWLTRLSKV